MFGYVMAKSALVSNVTLVNNHGDTVKSSVDARYGHQHSFFVHLSLKVSETSEQITVKCVSFQSFISVD